MNSRKKRIVPRVALSALMLSAIAAGPVAANAASNPASNAAPVVTAASSVKAAAVTETLAAVKLPDPLELAKQYAPDTVEAWESLLAKYDSLQATLKPAVVSIKLEKAGAVAEGRLSGNVKATEAGTITLEAVEGDVLFDIKDIGTAQALPIQGVSVPAFTVSTEAVSAESGAPALIKLVDAEHTISGKTGSVTLAAATFASGDVLQGRIELAKVAESKDAEAIRGALAKLFEAYEAHVEELQSSK